MTDEFDEIELLEKLTDYCREKIDATTVPEEFAYWQGRKDGMRAMLTALPEYGDFNSNRSPGTDLWNVPFSDDIKRNNAIDAVVKVARVAMSHLSAVNDMWDSGNMEIYYLLKDVLDTLDNAK